MGGDVNNHDEESFFIDFYLVCVKFNCFLDLTYKCGMAENNCYKYNTDKDILHEFRDSINGYLNPLYKSYRLDKKTFALQIVNFVLVFFILYFLFDWSGFLDFAIKGIFGSSMAATKIFLVLIITCVGSILNKSEVFKWQTLFEMNFTVSRRYFFRFCVAIVGLYIIKNCISYETRNKK